MPRKIDQLLAFRSLLNEHQPSMECVQSTFSKYRIVPWSFSVPVILLAPPVCLLAKGEETKFEEVCSPPLSVRNCKRKSRKLKSCLITAKYYSGNFPFLPSLKWICFLFLPLFWRCSLLGSRFFRTFRLSNLDENHWWVAASRPVVI